MATTSSKSLATMTAAERLQFYREAAKQAKAPSAQQAETTLAEVVGKLGASFANFGTDVRATYNFHRYQ